MENHQRLIFWTGGKQENANGCAQKARGIPFLPAPTPLRRAAIVVFLWGGAEFEMVVSAGSLRNTLWGDEEITWLFCKGMRTAEIKPEGTGMMVLLIPAQYVTAIAPGPTFRITSSKRSDDIGVFAPIHAAPANAVAVAEIERVLAELIAPEMN